MKEAKIALYEDVIIPELHSVRDELNRALVPSFGNNLYPDIDTSAIAVLQANKKEMAEWLEKCPFITNQDKQRMMGVTEDPDYPKYTLNSNLVPGRCRRRFSKTRRAATIGRKRIKRL